MPSETDRLHGPPSDPQTALGLHDLFEQTLPLDQRQTPQILAILPQQIERIEVLRRPPARFVKPRAAILAQVDDLAVQHSLARQGLASGGAEFWERRELVVVAGTEEAATAIYICEGAEAVVLQLEDIAVVIERFGQDGQRHRREAKRRAHRFR